MNAIRIRKFFAFSNFHWSLTSEHSHRHTFFFWLLVNSKDSFIISAYFSVQLHTLHMSSIRREINGKNFKIGLISFGKFHSIFFFRELTVKKFAFHCISTRIYLLWNEFPINLCKTFYNLAVFNMAWLSAISVEKINWTFLGKCDCYTFLEIWFYGNDGIFPWYFVIDTILVILSFSKIWAI